MKKLSKRKQAKMKENARKHAQRLSDEINRAWENGAYMGLPKHKFTERLKKIDEDRRKKGPIK